jgi:hypothetical protein
MLGIVEKTYKTGVKMSETERMFHKEAVSGGHQLNGAVGDVKY